MPAEEGATPSVVLRCFPMSDGAFRTFVEAAVAEFDVAALAAGDGPRVLERALRDEYPQVVVRPRTDLAALEFRPAPMWYVYRDGKVVPGDEDNAQSPPG